MRRAWLATLLLLGAWKIETRKDPDVEEGNRRFAQGDFAGAIEAYHKAEHSLPDDPGVHYDLGAALYSQAQAVPDPKAQAEMYGQAEEQLRIAGDAQDPKLRSRAHYNLGNTLLGEKKVRESVDEYKKSLQIDPQNDDARYNLELAQEILRQQPPPQQQQQPSDQNQQQQKQNQQQGQQPPQDPQQKSSDQQKQPQDQQPQDQQPQQQGQQQQQQGQQQQQQQGQQQQQPQDQQQGQPQQQQAQADQQKPPDQQQEQGAQESEEESDRQRKFDALTRRSKDLQVEKLRQHAGERKLGRAVKDW